MATQTIPRMSERSIEIRDRIILIRHIGGYVTTVMGDRVTAEVVGQALRDYVGAHEPMPADKAHAEKVLAIAQQFKGQEGGAI